MKYELISSSCNLFEIAIEVSKKLGVMGMNGIFHCISHCDHSICFVMDQGCHNNCFVLTTKKGEKVVENIKTKTKVLFLKNNIAKWQKFTTKTTLIKPLICSQYIINLPIINV
jgi:hypothetical protein